MAEDVPASVFASIDKSGFPFQTAIEHVVQQSKSCSVHASEYPWRGSDNRDNFLDLIATKNPFILTVECKKTTVENITFLRPLGGANITTDVAEFKAVRTVYYAEGGRIVSSWGRWQIWPASPSCEFAVVGKGNFGRDERLLEKDAILLIRATDALAVDTQEYIKLEEKVAGGSLYVPVIVTNARIYTARYKPPAVSLETGKFTSAAQVAPAPWVRFTKSFTAELGRTLGQRSVYVVNSTSFEQFLDLLEPAP